MRSGLLRWILVAAGIVVVLLVTLAIGHRDKSGEKVPPGEWAQTVCGTVGTWRGEMEAIIEQVRTPPSKGDLGVAEPQSETPQTRRALVRSGLQESVRATKTLVEGIDDAGTPDSAQGGEAATKVSDWADTSKTNLEDAQKALEKEAQTLEEAVTQYGGAARAIGSTLATGVKTIASVAKLDPVLANAFRESSTCQQLREEQSST
jgi:hypothetical protein